MQNHFRHCIVGNINCPIWRCARKMKMGEVMDHLSYFHERPEALTIENGELKNSRWEISWQEFNQGRDGPELLKDQ